MGVSQCRVFCQTVGMLCSRTISTECVDSPAYGEKGRVDTASSQVEKLNEKRDEIVIIELGLLTHGHAQQPKREQDKR